MDTKKDLNRRAISTENYALRPYEDNCEELTLLCQTIGLKPAELLRELVDEALLARRSPSITEAPEKVAEQNRRLIEQNRILIEQNSMAIERYERLLEKLESLDGRWEAFKRGLIQELRQFYAILVEALSASISARRLIWKYVARTILKESGVNEEAIVQQEEVERRASLLERETTVKVLEQSVREM